MLQSCLCSTLTKSQNSFTFSARIICMWHYLYIFATGSGQDISCCLQISALCMLITTCVHSQSSCETLFFSPVLYCGYYRVVFFIASTKLLRNIPSVFAGTDLRSKSFTFTPFRGSKYLTTAGINFVSLLEASSDTKLASICILLKCLSLCVPKRLKSLLHISS